MTGLSPLYDIEKDFFVFFLNFAFFLSVVELFIILFDFIINNKVK